MLDIEKLSPRAHRIVVMGAFHHDDARRMVEFARESLEAKRGGNLLIDLTSLADFSFAAVSEELMHIPALLRWVYSLDRIAIISDEDWLRSAARLESALLPGVEYQVYDDDEAEAARAWVMEEAEQPHTGAFHPIDVGNPAIAAFELSGRLDREESERGVAMVRARLEDPDCSRLMLVVRHWHGFDLDTVFSSEVLRGKLDLIDEIDRYAIVGGPDWIGAMAGMVGAMLKPEIRTFDLDDQDEALAWLSEQAVATAAP